MCIAEKAWAISINVLVKAFIMITFSQMIRPAVLCVVCVRLRLRLRDHTADQSDLTSRTVGEPHP